MAFEYAGRLLRRGYPVRVVTPRPAGPGEAHPPHVRLVRPLLRAGLGAFLPGLPFLLKGFEVVHLHYPFFGGALPAALARGPALVTTYHMDPLAPGLKGLVFKLSSRLALPFLVRRSRRILVSSLDYARASALWRLAGEKGREKIEEHPLGVDIDRFHPGETQSSEERTRAVLFVGSLDRAHYFKGLEGLLRALAGVEDLPWRLDVVGAGELLDRYREAARELGIGERVRFLGKVSDRELPRLYREACLHCMPSTGRSEAFGLVALEAAASGIPTVASDLPGVRTVVERGITGLLVPPGDVSALRNALAELLSDPERAARMGRAARRRAERFFSWEKCVDELERLYKEIARRPEEPTRTSSSPPPS